MVSCAPLPVSCAIAVVIAIIVALNADSIARMGLVVLAAVVLHNLVGLTAGYGCARLLTGDRRIARTLAIEVGMQNSGLAVALAQQYFSAAAALPGAVFSVWHNVSGALFAAAAREVAFGTGTAAIPEPASIALLASGSLVLIRRRRR